MLLIGTSLVADGLGHHLPKGYIYFATGFSVRVETLNLRMARKGRGRPGLPIRKGSATLPSSGPEAPGTPDRLSPIIPRGAP